MADEHEELRYEFTGDVKSLQEAVKQSIALLKNYGEVVSKVATSGDFDPSADSVDKFSKSLEQALDPMQQMLAVYKKLQKAQEKQLYDSVVADNKKLTDELKQEQQLVIDKRQALIDVLKGGRNKARDYIRKDPLGKGNRGLTEGGTPLGDVLKSANAYEAAAKEISKVQNRQENLADTIIRQNEKVSTSFSSQLQDRLRETNKVSTALEKAKLDQAKRQGPLNDTLIKANDATSKRYSSQLKARLEQEAKQAKEEKAINDALLNEQKLLAEKRQALLNALKGGQAKANDFIDKDPLGKGKRGFSKSNDTVGDVLKGADQYNVAVQEVHKAQERQKALADSLIKASDEAAKRFGAQLKEQMKDAVAQEKLNAANKKAASIESDKKAAQEKAFKDAEFARYTERKSKALGGLLVKLDRLKEMFGVELPTSVSVADAEVLRFVEKLDRLGKKAERVIHKFAKLSKHIINFATVPLKLLGRGLTLIHDKLHLLGRSNGLMKKFLGFGAGAALGKMFGNAAKDASDMAEAANLFNVAMAGGATDEAERVKRMEEANKFLYGLSESYGLDATGLQNTVGLFYEMAHAVEMPHEAAAKLSKDLTKMSLNVASLFNYDFETVADNMSSGLRGMSKSVFRYGMDIRVSTVEAFAKSEFGIQQQFETMKEADREILRYLLMLKQAGDSSSDLANTINQPANQLRIFKEQIIGLSRQVGRFLINAFQPILPIINGVTMAFRLMTKAIADLLGLWDGLSDSTASTGDNIKESAKGVSGLGNAAGATAKQIKNLLAPIDELNILTQNSGGGGGGGAGSLTGEFANPVLLQALQEAEVKFGEIKLAATETRDKVLEFFGFEYVFDPEKSTDKFIQMISGGFADKLAKAFKKQDFKAVGKIIGDKFNSVVDVLPEKFSWDNLGPAISTKIENLADSLSGFIGTVHWDNVGKAIGELLKTTIKAIDYAGITFDWTGFGKALANTINGFMATHSLEAAGTAIANWLNKIAEFASSFSQTFDWHEFGETLSTTINNFFATWDIKKLASAAKSIILGLLDTLQTTIDTVDWVEVGKAIGDAIGSIDWIGVLKTCAKTIIAMLKSAIRMQLSITGGLINALFGSEKELQRQIDSTGRESLIDKKPSRVPTQSGGSYLPAGVGPHFATGGVVTRPTRALIGEAGRAEAVIPLDNSPQMNDFINKVAGATNSEAVITAIRELTNVVQNKDTNAYLDGRLVSRYTYKYNKQTSSEHGRSFVRRGMA